VSHNLVKINRAFHIAHGLGMSNPPLPSVGPRKLEDEFGAGAAVIMATRPRDPSVTASTVQFETVHKMK
jgi:hypothetical protein